MYQRCRGRCSSSTSVNMRALVLLVCLSVSCFAQRPQRCTSPPLLTGSMSVSSANEKLTAFAKYTYDSLRQRIRVREWGSYQNKSFHIDALFLYREGVVYKINSRNQTCCKKTLCRSFHPLAVPQDATLLGQVVLGSSSAPEQGVLVNTWAGKVEHKNTTAKYMSTVTEFGCVPVSTLFYTDKTGWIVASFFNNVLGLADPQMLIPPSFCRDARLETENGPETFFSML